MRKKFCLVAMALAMATANLALAHTGGTAGNPPEHLIEWTDALTTQVTTHFEPASQDEPHKGWWIATLRNSTSLAWSSVSITVGQNDRVAIVESATSSDFLVDEFGYSNISITSTASGTASYDGYIGYRDYDNGSRGNLYSSATYWFDSPITAGQAVRFFVYTDNSYYDMIGSCCTLMGLVGILGRRRRIDAASPSSGSVRR